VVHSKRTHSQRRIIAAKSSSRRLAWSDAGPRVAIHSTEVGFSGAFDQKNWCRHLWAKTCTPGKFTCTALCRVQDELRRGPGL
jgi:hypothetical protein